MSNPFVTHCTVSRSCYQNPLSVLHLSMGVCGAVGEIMGEIPLSSLLPQFTSL